MPSLGKCFICHPTCGLCVPAQKKAMKCPECDSYQIFDRIDMIKGRPIICKSCGHDLTDEAYSKVEKCNYSGLLCAYPCGRGKESTPEDGYKVCVDNVKPLTSRLRSA